MLHNVSEFTHFVHEIAPIAIGAKFKIVIDLQ